LEEEAKGQKKQKGGLSSTFLPFLFIFALFASSSKELIQS
jgi:hypothetical protein